MFQTVVARYIGRYGFNWFNTFFVLYSIYQHCWQIDAKLALSGLRNNTCERHHRRNVEYLIVEPPFLGYTINVIKIQTRDEKLYH